MTTVIVTRGIQGPPGPAGAPGGTQPVAPGTLIASMFAPGVLPADTDGLPEGESNRYFTATLFASTALAGTGIAITDNGDGTFTFAATGGGGGGGGPADTDALAEGESNLYFTPARVNGAIAVAGGLTKSYANGVTTITGPGSGGGSGPATTDALPEGATNKYASGPAINARIAVAGSLSRSYNSTTGVTTITGSGGTGGSGLSAADQAKLNSFKVWIPSDTSGATDMTSELQAFVAANQGYVVKVPDSATILLNDAFKTVTTGDIMIDFGKATIRYNNTADFALYLNNVGNADPAAPSDGVAVNAISEVVVNTDARVSRATLATAKTWKRFEWVALYSNDNNPAKSGGKLGEIAQLMTDVSGTALTFTRRLNRHGFYTSGIRARKLDGTRRVHIKGGLFTANGNPHNPAITDRAGGILVQGFVDPMVEDVVFENSWSEGLRFQCCAAPRWVNITIRDVGNLALYQGYTYGVRLYAMNDCADGRDLVLRNARHAGITTDGTTATPTTSNWFALGIPTNGVVTGVHAYNCHGSPIDDHEEGDGFVYSDIVVQFPYQDENISGSFTGLGAQLHASNTTLKNYTQIGGTRGIKINNLDHGFEDQVTLENITIKDLTATASVDGDVGIEINDLAAFTNKRHIRINGYHPNNVGIACKVGTAAKVTATNYHATRVKTAMTVAAGADVKFKGPASFDYRFNPRTAPYNGVVLASSTAKCVFGVEPVLVRDINSPTALMTGSGVIWTPSMIDDRSGSASAAAIHSGSFTTATVARIPWTAP